MARNVSNDPKRHPGLGQFTQRKMAPGVSIDPAFDPGPLFEPPQNLTDPARRERVAKPRALGERDPNRIAGPLGPYAQPVSQRQGGLSRQKYRALFLALLKDPSPPSPEIKII
jgi:hypothetical protein